MRRTQLEQTKSDLICTLLSSVLSEEEKISQLTQFVKTYYLSDPTRFSFDPKEAVCYYNKNGKQCVVGLFLTEAEAVVGDGNNWPVKPLFRYLAGSNPVINSVPRYIWMELQIWHDMEASKFALKEQEQQNSLKEEWFDDGEEFESFLAGALDNFGESLDVDPLFGDDYYLTEE